tara:strand:- start:549 stop:908 length:360 start_codon:yes stop_codon:yes gene_type:complete
MSLHVKELTDKDFSLKDNDNTYVLMDFYAAWCPHCKRLAPEYEKAATQICNEGIKCKFLKLDADRYEEIGRNQKVRYYPDVRLYNKGNFIKAYEGPTEGEQATENLISFIKEHISGLKF